MKKNWKLFFGIQLIVLSALLYGTHYLIFRDSHHIFIYLLGDIAFVPFEVLLVTLIIHEVLEARERRERLEKMNMAIGVFFSEIGADLIRLLAGHDRGRAGRADVLGVRTDWREADFKAAAGNLKNHEKCLKPLSGQDFEEIADFMRERRSFLLELLRNPNLLEHESFTDLLWAVFHLADELSHRENVAETSDKDSEHLQGDAERAYGYLVSEWLQYMQHLQASYPYLFSLAVRINPFRNDAKAEL